MNVKEKKLPNGNTVVVTHPLDNNLHSAAWEALKIIDVLILFFAKQTVEVAPIVKARDNLREALAAQGISQETIDAFEETE